jgi:hypothetical protein
MPDTLVKSDAGPSRGQAQPTWRAAPEGTTTLKGSTSSQIPLRRLAIRYLTLGELPARACSSGHVDISAACNHLLCIFLYGALAARFWRHCGLLLL